MELDRTSDPAFNAHSVRSNECVSPMRQGRKNDPLSSHLDVLLPTSRSQTLPQTKSLPGLVCASPLQTQIKCLPESGFAFRSAFPFFVSDTQHVKRVRISPVRPYNVF